MTFQPDWQYLREILELEHQQIRWDLERGDTESAQRHLETSERIRARLELITQAVGNLPGGPNEAK